MVRLYAVVIAIGIAVGLLMPGDKPQAISDTQSAQAKRDTLIVDAAQRGRERARYSSSRPSTTASTFGGGGSVVLQRGANGHFYVTAQVNGMPVHFLVDTGASSVALTTADAQRVGLQFSRGEFDAVGSGASGPVNGKLVTLDRVSLQGKTVEQVPGAIIDGGDISLLGQTFLGRMGKIEITGDTMIIR